MKAVKFLLVASVVLASSAALARTEPNSFLNKPANTHDALMSQVKNDAQVLSRFKRHFGMDKDQVVSYLSGLRAGTLKQDAVYLVYNVNESEEVRARVMFYKKGTRVWENAQGEPQLKMSCANPMVRGTDDQAAIMAPEGQPTDNLRPVDAPGDGEAADVVAADILPVEVEAEAQPAASTLLPAAVVSDIPLLASGGSSFNPLYLAPLAGLGFIRTGGGGGDDNPPPPVPEPATMIAIGLGGALFAARKKNKKS